MSLEDHELLAAPGEPAFAHKSYERYGGICQTYPLTPNEQKYDDTCRAIDALGVEIGGMSAGLFTASELTWFSWFVTKTFFFPKQEALDRQLRTLTELHGRLKGRGQ